MNNDYLDPINAEGMPHRADATFAMEFLLAAKSGVRNCAFALTETVSPEAREVVRRQLREALRLHEDISRLMTERGWLRAYDVGEQLELDLNAADTTLKIAEMKLFPDDTSRLGTFATPNK
ncbi:spore coat protein [Paenibacillus flagellatus]|uniref:Spore coat protein n=1 Tax=Paenibacillus flagellatus TaxID=2211139 RepID=A0A2V5KL68_9BACL|nr:spore coat protein [Paenibacillus flagellatus]PYI55690.1 spore coat protein [Paenibacillus flagellatus]